MEEQNAIEQYFIKIEQLLKSVDEHYDFLNERVATLEHQVNEVILQSAMDIAREDGISELKSKFSEVIEPWHPTFNKLLGKEVSDDDLYGELYDKKIADPNFDVESFVTQQIAALKEKIDFIKANVPEEKQAEVIEGAVEQAEAEIEAVTGDQVQIEADDTVSEEVSEAITDVLPEQHNEVKGEMQDDKQEATDNSAPQKFGFGGAVKKVVGKVAKAADKLSDSGGGEDFKETSKGPKASVADSELSKKAKPEEEAPTTPPATEDDDNDYAAQAAAYKKSHFNRDN